MLRRRRIVLFRAAARLGIDDARVLVLVAVDAKQLPVRAVGRIVVVVAVLVVHGELAQARRGKFARATGADPRQDLQRSFAVIGAHAHIMILPCTPDSSGSSPAARPEPTAPRWTGPSRMRSRMAAGARAGAAPRTARSGGNTGCVRHPRTTTSSARDGTCATATAR